MSDTAHSTRSRVAAHPWQALQRRLDLANTMGWLGAYLLICLIAGLLGGALWFWVVDLPGYTLDNNFYARMGELARAQVFSADAWLCGLGVLAAPSLGWLAWRWFGRLGWPSAVIAALAGIIASAVTAGVGHILGPDNLEFRIANAQPSSTEIIPVPLNAHTAVFLAVWAGLAVAPVLIAATIAPVTAKDPRGWSRLDAPEAAPKERKAKRG